MSDIVVEFAHTPCVMFIDNIGVCTLGVDVCTRSSVQDFLFTVGTSSLSLGDKSSVGRVS